MKQDPVWNVKQDPAWNAKQVPAWNVKQVPAWNAKQVPVWNVKQVPVWKRTDRQIRSEKGRKRSYRSAMRFTAASCPLFRRQPAAARYKKEPAARGAVPVRSNRFRKCKKSHFGKNQKQSFPNAWEDPAKTVHALLSLQKRLQKRQGCSERYGRIARYSETSRSTDIAQFAGDGDGRQKCGSKQLFP